MANIKTTLCAESNCGLLINNISGFKSISNPYGFLTPGIDVPIASKDYYVNDVYFFTYLIKNNPDGEFKNISILGNSAKQINFIADQTFENLSISANISQHISFTEDGYYSVFQLAIPKENVKNLIQSSAIVRYHIKPNLEIWSETEKIDLLSLIIDQNTDWSRTNIVMSRTDFVSKCFLENCFNAILEVFAKRYMTPLCKNTDPMIMELKEKRDLLFAITNTIQYYVELGLYNKAAKLISDITYCNICSEYITQTTQNCNCHG